MLSKSEQLEIMKSAGYTNDSAKSALNIGVLFFDSLDEIKECEKANDLEPLRYDKGILNGKEVFFVDTSIIQ